MTQAIRSILFVFLFLLTGLHSDYTNAKSIIIPLDPDVINTIGNGTSNSLKPEHIEILVWNLYKGKLKNWEHDYKKIGHHSDILILQEMYLSESMMDIFLGHVSHEYHTATSFMYKKEKIETGVTTASHAKAIETTFRRSPVVEPILRSPKITLFSRYQIEGSDEILMVANFHGVNFVSAYAFQRHLHQVRDQLKHHKGPIIWAGDFNSWTQQKTDFMMAVMKELKLKEVTYKKDQRKKIMGYPLDYIFYRGLKLKEATTLGHVQSSDHTPMRASFSYPLDSLAKK